MLQIIYDYLVLFFTYQASHCTYAFWPLIVGAVGSIVGSAIGAGQSNRNADKSLQATRETNQANAELAAQQNQWNIEQWERENAYNDPRAQAQRLRAVGLSSAAAAQAVQGIPAGSVQSADLANQQAPDPSAFNQQSVLGEILKSADVMSLVRGIQDVKRNDIQNKMLQNEEEFQRPFLFSRLDRETWANLMAQRDLYEAGKTWKYRKKSIIADYHNKVIRNNYELLGVQLQALTYEKIAEELSFFRETKGLQIDKLSAELGKIVADTHSIELDNALHDVRKRGMQLDNQLTSEQIESEKVDREGKKIQNKIAELDEILKRHGCPDSMSGKLAAFIDENKMTVDQVKSFLGELNSLSYFQQDNGSLPFRTKWGDEYVIRDRKITPLTRKFIERDLLGDSSDWSDQVKKALGIGIQGAALYGAVKGAKR